MLLVACTMFSQERRSRADELFFEYAYQEAIRQYQKEQLKRPLTNQQSLNLADSYLKTENYERAASEYLEVYKRDTTMSTHHFNKMLQAMARTSGMDRVKAFLATKKSYLKPELLENADFNFEVLEGEGGKSQTTEILNVNSNSPQSDFSPAFYEDKLLFTTARAVDSKEIYGPSGESFLDIFIARIRPDGNIFNPNPFTGIPDSKFHEATPFYSKELKKVFYIRSNSEGESLTYDESGKNALALGMAGPNGEFRYLLKDLSKSFYYPFYDAENGKLYFAATFEDSYGGTDLYYVYTNNGLIMSGPINLGPRVNTPGNEIAPYIYEGSLFYSSDIFYGLGGMDIYKSEIQQDGSFSIPVNLGHGFNSEYDDFGCIIKQDDSGQYIGYFSSNRKGGKGNDDIYTFKAAEKPGLKTLVFRGIVMNSENDLGIDKVAIRLFDADSTMIKETYTASNGSYRIEVPYRENVALRMTKPEFGTYSREFPASALQEIQGKALDVRLPFIQDVLRTSDSQTQVKVNKFFFERNSSNITPEIETELQKVVETLKQFPHLRIKIESHTDSRGGTTTNQRLSQARADVLKDYLLANGVAEASITEAVGMGESMITNNCTNGVYCLEILHKQNERQLFIVENYEGLVQ